MPTDILILSDPWENRVAILEDGSLEYYSSVTNVIGSIFKGKVQNVLPGMGASFVDIGLGRNAFLYVDDINKTPLNIGDVEVTGGRSGLTINEKVSRATTFWSRSSRSRAGSRARAFRPISRSPGRYLILMPTGKYSRRVPEIESPAERTNRLEGRHEGDPPEGMATVVRTAAGGVSDAELIADLGVLLRMWHGIVEQYNRAPSPSLLHKDMNLVFKAARDFITPEVGHVYIDDQEETEKVRDFMRLLGPQYLERIETYSAGKRLFPDYHVDDEVSKLMRPKCNLPSGGSIVIETTEAFTIIDVNSGKFTGGKNLEDTILRTNIEAAAEIARQVRLRDIGGIIVCDFIDMRRESSRNQVIETLEKGLRRDRTRSTIQSFSALGLLEFTRKRVGKDLAQQLRSACPTCTGLGTVMSPESVTIDTFRKLRDMHAAHAGANGNGKSAPVHVVTFPTVAAQMDFWYEDELEKLSEEIGTKIDIRVDQAINPERPRIVTNGAAPKEHPLTVRVGDELEVEIISARLPNPTSGLAVIDGRLVEIENAAGAVGQSMKIKVIDIDDDEILAEPRTPVPGEEGAKRRRRRGGRGRKKPLTAAEQVEELRQLAEEAAKGVGVRAAAIGISTVEEAETEEAAVRASGHASTAALIEKVGEPVGGMVTADPAAPGGPGEFNEENGGHRRRRRRRRRGARHSVEGLNGAVAADGTAAAAPAAEKAPAEPIAAASYGGETEEGGRKRRRRRRRRRGRGGAGIGEVAATENGTVPERHIFRVDGDGGAYATGETAPRQPSRAIANVEPARPPALEPPPPSLHVPEEPAGKPTRPSRRRRTTAPDEGVTASIQATAEVPALPAPKRRTRKAAAETATVAEAAAPKRRATRKAAASAEPAEAAPKRTRKASTATTARKTSTSTRKKASTTSGSRKKSS